MPNMMKLEFIAFDVFRNNYLSWILKHLEAIHFRETIKVENNISL